MRTTITLDDDVHGFVSYYANARGISLSAAMNELIRKAETAPAPAPEHQIVYGFNGFPMFPAAEGTITSEAIKKLEEEAFDPKKFT